MQRQDLTSSIFTIDGVLTADECREMIAFANARGFDSATINAWDGPRLDKEARNNDRVIVDDLDLARRLWARVHEFIPRTRAGRQVRGLNERFRFYRYTLGQRFSWHADAPFARDNGELSLLTFMIYTSFRRHVWPDGSAERLTLQGEQALMPNDRIEAVEKSGSKPFGVLLTLGLALPLLIAIGSWSLQWLLRFPPRSAGASLTAAALVLGLVAEIIPVPIAVTKLIRHPTLRSRGNLALTIIAALFLVPGVMLAVALALGP